MTESHVSLRDDYEVSIRELDAMVEIALTSDGVLGARMTGAGFGGCAVAMVSMEEAPVAAARIAHEYRKTTGRAGRVFASRAGEGTGVSTAGMVLR